MKRMLLLLFVIFCLNEAFAQKTVFDIGINSGLFSYSGISTNQNTFMNHSSFKTYTNSIYGAKKGLSYGLSINMKHLLAKNHFIMGVDFGYEMLRSKVSIIGIASSGSSLTAEGSSYLNTDFLNLHPNLGYRFNLKNVSLDITGGFDLGFVLKAQEKGKAIDQNGAKYTTELDRKHTKIDYRPRIQLAVNHNKIGAYIGYSYGLQNYTKGMVGGPVGANAQLIRFGLTHQIK